jgi:peptide/nickel transport system ATP-binding protein
MNAPLLEIDDLVVSFTTRRGRIEAVRGVTLQVSPGETLGVVGESGSGKSVTMQAVMGVVDSPGAVESGDIRWRGKSLLANAAEAQDLRGRDIVMVFQDAMTSLDPLFSIGTQIGEVLARHRGLKGPAARARTLELLELVGIPNAGARLNYLPHQFSGGMRQRIMIAMALAADPSLLVADEPTTALDVTIQAQIVDLLIELRDRLGLAIVLVTHDLGLVAELCDRVAVMYAGRIVEVADVWSLFAAPAHPYTAGLLRATPAIGDLPDRLDTIEGSPPDPSDLPAGCAFRLRCPRADAACVVEPPMSHPDTGRSVLCWHPEPRPAATRPETAHV